MGAPSSAFLSEIYLQLVEHTEFILILKQNNILGYFSFVHDILIAYNKVYRVFNSLVPLAKIQHGNRKW
jgi:hypothetical protein